MDDLLVTAGVAWEEAITPVLIQDSFKHMEVRFTKSPLEINWSSEVENQLQHLWEYVQ